MTTSLGHSHGHQSDAQNSGRSAASSPGEGAGALLGLGQDSLGLADTVVNYSLTLPNSRSNENEADLIGLELAARAGYNPQAAVRLWEKMGQATGNSTQGLAFLSTHPSGPQRIRQLQANVPKVQGLYEQAKRR